MHSLLTKPKLLCRQLQLSVGLVALAVKAVVIIEIDFAISAAWPGGFQHLVFDLMLGKGAFCHALEHLIPRPAYLWCGGWTGLAVAISYVGLASFGAGQLPVALQSTHSSSCSDCCQISAE